MTLILAALVAFFLGLVVGNHGGDQATLRDCATKSTAHMVGGGSIKCEVVREKDQS